MNESLEISVAWRPHNSWRAVPLLRRVGAHVASAEGFRRGQLSVAVVGARAMSTLHERYMGQSGPTDVLSFDLDSDRSAGRLDGEVIICTDVARRKSRSRGGTLAAARAELALYLVHGILHIAGYDDHGRAEYERMHAREDELLTQLGLGSVFHDGAGA